jgi:hypothetical protein
MKALTKKAKAAKAGKAKEYVIWVIQDCPEFLRKVWPKGPLISRVICKSRAELWKRVETSSNHHDAPSAIEGDYLGVIDARSGAPEWNGRWRPSNRLNAVSKQISTAGMK